jgi:hypothetical protein
MLMYSSIASDAAISRYIKMPCFSTLPQPKLTSYIQVQGEDHERENLDSPHRLQYSFLLVVNISPADKEWV